MYDFTTGRFTQRDQLPKLIKQASTEYFSLGIFEQSIFSPTIVDEISKNNQIYHLWFLNVYRAWSSTPPEQVDRDGFANVSPPSRSQMIQQYGSFFGEIIDPKDVIGMLDKSMNCGGLAFGSGGNVTLAQIRAKLASCIALNNCDDKCNCGKHKCWFWEIDRTSDNKTVLDFHITCGKVAGDDPTKKGDDPICDTKTGFLPVNVGVDEQGNVRRMRRGWRGPLGNTGQINTPEGTTPAVKRTVKPGFPKCYCCDLGK